MSDLHHPLGCAGSGSFRAGVSERRQRRAGNAVTRWVEHALDGVRTRNVGTPNGGQLYAMVTVAMFDGVNSIGRARNHGRSHVLVAPSDAPVNGRREVRRRS